MPDVDRIQRAALFLWEEHHARKPFEPMPAPLAPRTVDEAYAVQEGFHARMAEVHGPIAGHKIALTTPVMQQMVGFHAPIAGAILAETIHSSPVTLRGSNYVRLGIECEIAVRLGMDLPAAKAPYSRALIADTVSAVMPAFEVVDDRQADYSQLAAHVLSLIADNAWNAGVVLGSPLREWHGLDLATARGVMVLNGVAVGEGHGRDVMGHPFDALVWLVNMLARRGKSLRQGMIVMTGSIVTTRFVNAGDAVSFSMDGLGEVRLGVV
jgi:2-keto-4-pentenoate hydratase